MNFADKKLQILPAVSATKMYESISFKLVNDRWLRSENMYGQSVKDDFLKAKWLHHSAKKDVGSYQQSKLHLELSWKPI